MKENADERLTLVTSEKIMSPIRRRRVVAGVMILPGAILLTYYCENATNCDAENAFRDITFSRPTRSRYLNKINVRERNRF